MKRASADSPKAAACIEAILAILDEHGFSLAHEDYQGAFILESRRDTDNVEINERWLRAAFDDSETE